MAFFKKLKERLFRSSSKIDEGLEAIVSDGGEEETVDTAALEAQEAEARAAEEAAQAEREAEAAREAEAQAAQEAAERAAQEAEARRQADEQAAREAEAQRLAEEQATREAQAKRAAEEQAAQEAAERRAAEEQAAAEAAAQRAAEEQAAAEAAAKRAAEEQAAREAEAERAAQAQAAREAAEQEATEAAERAEVARRAQEAAQAAQLAAEEAAAAKAVAEAEVAQEAAAQAAREAAELALREQAAQKAAERAAQEAAERAAAEAAEREAAAQKAAEEQAEREAAAQRAAQEQAEREAAAERAVQEQAAREAEAKRQAEEAAEQEAARQAETERHAEAERQAAVKAAEEAAERAKQAQAVDAVARREVEATAATETPDIQDAPGAPAPLRTTLTPVAPDLIEETPAEPEKKPGFFGRLMGRAAPKTVVRRTLDDDMLEQLEELLITADMGVDTALRVTANMAEGRFGKKLSVTEIKELMASEVARIMEPVAKPLPLYAKTPQVVLVVGVNGSGKTTTIGKLASQFRAAGKKVVIAAGDTFRAAAVEQLQVWGDRAGVPVLTAPQGTDPASLAFDALTQAQADGADLLMIDTAGRLQNRGDLMEELAKIVRVIRKKDETAPHNTLLVLDATTGQNALSQVKVFQEISDVSGLVMTKLDGTAKGGVLVALADKFGLPIHAIGVGEQIDDLSPFDPQEFADALVGLER